MKKLMIIVIVLISGGLFLFSTYKPLPLYSANIDTYEQVIDSQIYVPKNAAKEKLIEEITKVLSRRVFKLPMEFVGIEDYYGAKIAVINLKESTESIDDLTWKGQYFQGSTGSNITSTTLKETYLQRDYEGDYIDGVKFLYEGKRMDFEPLYDLAATQYRTTDYKLNELENGERLLDRFVLSDLDIMDNGRTVYYALSGEFEANVKVYYDVNYKPMAILHVFESPIRQMRLIYELEGLAYPIIENFDYFYTIVNTEPFLSALKEQYPDAYKALMDTTYTNVSVRLSNFQSIVYVESEYENVVTFEGFVE